MWNWLARWRSGFYSERSKARAIDDTSYMINKYYHFHVCNNKHNLIFKGSPLTLSQFSSALKRCREGYGRRMTAFEGEQCVLSSCDPNPCLNEGRCSVLGNATVLWGAETLAIACECPPPWTGAFCAISKRASAGFLNWWLLPVILVIILIRAFIFSSFNALLINFIQTTSCRDLKS